MLWKPHNKIFLPVPPVLAWQTALRLTHRTPPRPRQLVLPSAGTAMFRSNNYLS